MTLPPVRNRMIRRHAGSPCTPLLRGFTLVELLTVIAVMVVLISLSMPAIRPLFQSRGRAAALAELSDAVAVARSAATARKGYAWLAMMNTSRNGREGVSATIFVSRSGAADTAEANVKAYAPPRFLPEVKLVALGNVNETVRAALPVGAVDVCTAGVSFPGKSGTLDYEAATESYAVTFTPGGEVLLTLHPTPQTPYEPQVALGVLAITGSGELDAILLIEGGSGNVKVIEP